MAFPLPLNALFADVPVTPGADEARRWASEELSKKVYQDARPGLGQLVVDWIKRAIDEFLHGVGTLSGNAGLLLLIGLAAAVAIAAVLIVRPRLNRRRAAAAAVFAGDEVLTAAAHRELAAAAAGRGDLSAAVAEQFRALVRAAEERDVCDAAPGRTAAEVAAELGRAFPRQSAELGRAADVFNAVLYGHTGPTAATYAALVDLDAALLAATPARADGTADRVAAP